MSGERSGSGAISGRGLAAALNRRPVAILIFAIAITRAGVMWYGLARTFSPVDFSIFYCSVVTMHEGGNPYTTDMHAMATKLGLEGGYVEQMNNSPALLLAMEPLALLPPHRAYWVWQAASATMFAAALFLLLWPAYSGLSGAAALSLAGLAIIFLPVGNNFAIAQSKMTALVALATMLRLMERKRDWSAGIVLGVIGLIQVFPLLLGGYLLLTRRWRAVAATIATVLVGGVIVVAMAGPANAMSFVTAVGSLASARWLSETSNISIAAFISRTVWSIAGPARGGFVELVRNGCVLGADVVVLALLLRATDWRRGEDPDRRTFSLWTVAAVMLSPTSWFHYLLLLLIPFAMAASAATRGALSARVGWAMAAAYLAIGFVGAVLQSMSHNQPLQDQLRGLEFVCALIAFVATYWFALEALPSRAQVFDDSGFEASPRVAAAERGGSGV